MMIADSDVLIEFLRGRRPGPAGSNWRSRLDSSPRRLSTALNCSAERKARADQEKVSRLLAALTVLAVTPEASERAAAVRRSLESQGQGIGMAEY